MTKSKKDKKGHDEAVRTLRAARTLASISEPRWPPRLSRVQREALMFDCPRSLREPTRRSLERLGIVSHGDWTEDGQRLRNELRDRSLAGLFACLFKNGAWELPLLDWLRRLPDRDFASAFDNLDRLADAEAVALETLVDTHRRLIHLRERGARLVERYYSRAEIEAARAGHQVIGFTR